VYRLSRPDVHQPEIEEHRIKSSAEAAGIGEVAIPPVAPAPVNALAAL
jgi:CO/xanthine dehydrogenase Mo-binding subunit